MKTLQKVTGAAPHPALALSLAKAIAELALRLCLKPLHLVHARHTPPLSPKALSRLRRRGASGGVGVAQKTASRSQA